MPLPPNSASLTVNTHQRRYDVDWLRVITLGLLIIYPRIHHMRHEICFL